MKGNRILRVGNIKREALNNICIVTAIYAVIYSVLFFLRGNVFETGNFHVFVFICLS